VRWAQNSKHIVADQNRTRLLMAMRHNWYDLVRLSEGLLVQMVVTTGAWVANCSHSENFSCIFLRANLFKTIG
jgi:hypothetical protein